MGLNELGIKFSSFFMIVARVHLLDMPLGFRRTETTGRR